MRPSNSSRVCRPRPAGHTDRTRGGFTLIELLVVVGILVVLLSILIPTVGAARRQARSTQCLSNLRQIGQGFKTYAANFDGAYPVAVHLDVPPSYLRLGPNVLERRWYDLIAPYVADSRIRTQNYTDIKRLRINSVVWGCPEYTKTLDLNASDPDSDTAITNDELRPGYGMNYYPSFFEDGGILGNLSYIRAGLNGRYSRMEQWKPGNRLLVADSPAHIVQSPDPLSRNSRWAPYDLPFAQGDFFIEARHGKAGAGRTPQHKQMSYTDPCIGALFVDGSAGLISVREAWMAQRNPSNIPTSRGGAAPPPP
jgi:prepilin-type N-terminal cleavage/methylation domain-containing protein